MCSCGFAINVVFGLGEFGLAFAGGDLARVDVAGQVEQSFGQVAGVGAVPWRPALGRHDNQQALVAAFDLHGQMVGGHLRGLSRDWGCEGKLDNFASVL